MAQNGFTLTVEGRRVLINLGQAPERFRSACREGLYETGKIVRSVLSAGILYGPKTGKNYSYKGLTKRASAPGEFSANRSGKLRKSYDFQVEGYRKMIFGSEVDYALWIEDGTSRMKARNNILQAINKSSSEVLQLLTNRLNLELKR